MRKTLSSRLLLGASLAALAAGAALAEEDDSRETFLGTISVQGGANPTAPLAGSVAKTSASTKTGTPILETPAAVSVIPRAQIAAQGATSLAEAVGYTAGVVTENFGADPRFDSLYLRGFNLENDKLLDGLRLMRSTQYPTSAPSFELYGLERVEVLKGPASVLYGAGTPAGVINMIQKRAQASGDTTELGFGFDSQGSWQVFGDANRVVNDRFAYRLTAKSSDTNTAVKQIDNRRDYLALSASYLLTDTTELEIMASMHDDAPQSPTGVPAAMLGVVDWDRLRSFDFGDPAINQSDRQMRTLSFGLTHDFGNGWKLNNTLRYTRHDWDYDSVYVSGGTASTATRGVIAQRESFESLGTDLRLSGEAATGGVSHKLTFGLDAMRLRESATTGFSSLAAIDITAPAYGGSFGAPWYTAQKDIEVTQLGLYGVDEMSFGKFRATLGLRREWSDQDGQNVTNYGSTDLTRKDAATTGQVSLGYVADNGLASYLSYATSYLPQPGADIDGRALDPTRGKQWELGVKYEPAAFEGLFSAALFDLRETDRNTTVTEGARTGLRQIGEARIRGLELEGVAELAQGWTLKAAYTRTDSKVLAGEQAGTALKNVPEHAASLWLSHDFAGKMQGLTLGGGLRHIGSRYADDANTARLGAVTLLDLGASYTWQNGVTGRINVSNLTDKAYVAGVGSFASYPGDERTVSASLGVTW
ncbi:TonB-dependent siderophore receptor [Rhodobacter capsulatus]|uniref:TonB-dependent ferrichrome receptor n=1 Tax=Rhodobacter capsulatus (strain ATCC BAA-309 / NBRC 16581 / SB1003) TaxID=272942 RepID=D5AVN2_RHOCB|nr:TonB-dependent siderophore receptor [Rhodobacter capsulatus]ADE87367.1 TonB-dependent ferrichrome receptor [Rhodobacter capsulatus SB 1003]ETE52119.1 TonB-denpendent receptor [Rhodobacter capsulatus Y262]MDS0927584.1 TonB-dependent siderophore receptor [Rhodobacter capsulatus]